MDTLRHPTSIIRLYARRRAFWVYNLHPLLGEVSAMLSRGTSNATLQPKRTKSIPSINHHSGSDAADTETVDQDALTAANLAYERANRRPMKQQSKEDNKNMNGPARDPPRLSRTQSIRFVGPKSMSMTNRTITRREAPGRNKTVEPHLQSIESEVAGFPLNTDNDALATALPEEFCEDHIASEPSSYRRLRKTKSLFSPGKTPSAVFAGGAPKSNRHFQRHSLQSSSSHNESTKGAGPSLHRSFSFRRGAMDRISTRNPQHNNHDAAVQLARDTYLREVEQQRLKERPSFLNLSRRQRSAKAFRRTVRTSSTNSYGSAVSSPLPLVESSKARAISSKARSFSQSWKEKMKRLFKKPSIDEETIPAQHLEASQPHYGDYNSSSGDWKQREFPFPEPDATLLHRVGSRESSLRSETAFVNKGSRPGSFRSVSSDEEENNDRSRVTSWTNSTAANTISMPIVVDRKRLSIINEDGGPHQPSSSALQEAPLKGHSKFRQPMKQMGTGRVEAQRIFSALQREIDGNSRNTTLEKGAAENDSDSDKPKRHQLISAPKRESSLKPSPRHINTSPPNSDETVGMDAARISVPNPAARINAFPRSDKTQENSCIRYQPDCVEASGALTPQEIARMNESSVSRSKRPLREVKSAFFPPSVHLERSNTSPFRRAMYASSEDENLSIGSQFADHRAMINSRLRNGSVTRSESIYSRSSSGGTVEPTGSVVSLAKSNRSSGEETAIVTRDRSPQKGLSPRQFFPERHTSPDSNGWKLSMSSKMRSLEDSERLSEHAADNFSINRTRHKRENAQLSGEDMKIGRLRSPFSHTKQPLGVINGNCNGRSQLMVHRGSSVNSGVPARTAIHRQNENLPFITPSPKAFKSTSQSNSLLSQFSSNSLRQNDSQASLASNLDSKRHLASRSPRHSPEREERLRRLRSCGTMNIQRTTTSPANSQTIYSNAHSSDEENDFSGVAQTQAGMNHKLVNGFLRSRRSEMRLSSEDSSDPAFI